MANIIRQIMTKYDTTITVHSYSTGEEVCTDVDISFNDKSLLNNKPISLNKDDLANLVQILIEAQNTE